MRVVIFTDTYPPEINGVATSCFNLTRTLKEHGEEVLVVTTNIYGKELSKEKEVVRIPGIELKWLYNYRLAYFYNEGAAKIIEDFKPDVFHIQADWGVGMFGSIMASKMKMPTAYTFHSDLEDYTYYVTHGHFDRAARGIIRSYVRHTANKIDEFITPSLKTKEYMRSIGVDGYINVIPTGIDFGAFSEENTDYRKLEEIKKEHHIDPDAYIILSLGRVAKEKSIDVCLRGYANFLRSKPLKKTLFVVVGGGPALKELQELSHELGIDENVRFLGPVLPKNVPLYYHLGDLFVSASITETQGLTFMEAMAAGVPLLARYDDSLLGTIHDGENGFFFIDESDFASKVSHVMELSKEKRSSIVQKAKEGLAPYSLEAFYQSIMEVYRRAIRKNW